MLPVVMLAVAALALVAVPATRGAADVLTNSNNTLRNGLVPGPTPPVPLDRHRRAVRGNCSATPWSGRCTRNRSVSNGTLLVATEDNNVYGLDPHTGTQQWNRALSPPFNSDDSGCGDLAPHIGVTGTPVVDPATNVAYFLNKQYRERHRRVPRPCDPRRHRRRGVRLGRSRSRARPTTRRADIQRQDAVAAPGLVTDERRRLCRLRLAL